MFTGIVTAVGTVTGVAHSADHVALTIAAPWDDLAVGESIAVAGACLTVVECSPGRFGVDAVVTTRGRTWLGDVTAGRRVNLERAVAAGDRLGGHLVQGHVDGLGEVVAVTPAADALLVDVRVPTDVWPVCILHGSITLDGVSLTINAMPADGTVQVALIPHTRDHTTLGMLVPGDRLHVEGDLLGKYVRRLMEARDV
ncbi:MAG: riboflavin synthase [Gemmatimonadales bacterium]